mgnify:CR=1 FL=1
MTDADMGAAFGAEDDFEALLAESFISQDQLEGRVVHGTVVAIENDNVVIDIGLKTEGRISTREFAKAGEEIAVFWSGLKPPWAMRSSAARKPAGKRPGTIWKWPMTKASRLTAPLSAGARVASRLICQAPWHSCRAAKSISARFATSRP